MNERIKIKRKIFDRKKGIVLKEIVESAILTARTPGGAWVRLGNGVELNRKNQDMIQRI